MKHFYGKYRGLVIDTHDPELRGRIRASVPVVLGNRESGWALPCVPFAGRAVGFLALPPVGAEVWIEFEGGNPDYPIWTGCFWEASEAPPEAFEPPAGGRVLVKTDGGLITIYGEASKAGGITLQTAAGQMLVLRDGPGSLEILDSNGNTIRLEPGGITVNSSAKVTINAATVEVSAGTVAINASMSRFSGDLPKAKQVTPTEPEITELILVVSGQEIDVTKRSEPIRCYDENGIFVKPVVANVGQATLRMLQSWNEKGYSFGEPL